MAPSLLESSLAFVEWLICVSTDTASFTDPKHEDILRSETSRKAPTVTTRPRLRSYTQPFLFAEPYNEPSRIFRAAPKPLTSTAEHGI